MIIPFLLAFCDYIFLFILLTLDFFYDKIKMSEYGDVRKSSDVKSLKKEIA